MVWCKVCAKKVNRDEELLTCSKLCGSAFHAKCANVSGEELVELKSQGLIKNWKCNTCEENITLTMNVQNQKEFQEKHQHFDINHIDQIITSKVKSAIGVITEEVINLFRKEIHALREENCNLKREIQTLQTCTEKLVSQSVNSSMIDGTQRPNKHYSKGMSSKNTAENFGSEDALASKNTQRKINVINTENRKKSEEAANVGNTQFQLAQSSSTMLDIVDKCDHLGSNDVRQKKFGVKYGTEQNSGKEDSSGSTGWSEVVKRKRSIKKPTIVGTATDIGIKAAVQYAHLHAYKLEPNLNADQLKNYLQSVGVQDVMCEKMDSKYPAQYSSFKISVKQDQLEKVKDANIWPKNARINRFLEHLKKT